DLLTNLDVRHHFNYLLKHLKFAEYAYLLQRGCFGFIHPLLERFAAIKCPPKPVECRGRPAAAVTAATGSRSQGERDSDIVEEKESLHGVFCFVFSLLGTLFRGESGFLMVYFVLEHCKT